MTSLPPAPFVDHVNIKNHGFEDSIAVSEVDPLHHHMNRIESAHGGLIATLLDNAMVSAGRAAAGPNAGLATIEMKLSFMRAGKSTFRCTARRLHSTMQYVIGSGGKTPPSTTPA